jgi:pilus assembly protein CpaF
VTDQSSRDLLARRRPGQDLLARMRRAVPSETSGDGTGSAPGRDGGAVSERAPAARRGAKLDVRARLQARLLDRLAEQELLAADEARIRRAVLEFVADVLETEDLALNDRERERLADELVEDTIGLGPLAPLMADPAVTDILVNGPDQVFVERFGHIEETDVRFLDADHVLRVIERISAQNGRRIDQSSPMVDLRLADGSRVNATIPPVSIDYPTLSIRRFGRQRLRRVDLERNGMLDPAMGAFLAAAVLGRRNMLVSGGTGAGKSTLLGALAESIPPGERIVTIEDTAELVLDQRHVVRLETRPPNIEGRGKVTARDLVINALRMRPSRILVGEVRGGEALDMLQAMNTGHDGSLTTVHANSPRDALARLETMVLMAGIDLPSRAIREQIAAAVDLVVHVERFEDGVRRVRSIAEVTGLEGNVPTMQDLFRFERGEPVPGVRGSTSRRIQGRFVATGVVPRCAAELRQRGIEVPGDWFRAPFDAERGSR